MSFFTYSLRAPKAKDVPKANPLRFAAIDSFWRFAMKAWLLKDFGLDNLQLGETATPQPKAGELLVKVGAVSLNFRDKAIVDGIYEPHRVPKPLIPVSDAAGAVVAVGDGVTRFKVGDRVNSHLYGRQLQNYSELGRRSTEADRRQRRGSAARCGRWQRHQSIGRSDQGIWAYCADRLFDRADR